MNESEIRLPADEQRRNDDQCAFEHGGEIFRLVVTELMVAIGRVPADLDGNQSRDCRQHIDDAFERVREEGDAPGNAIGEVLDGQHQQADADAAGGHRLEPAHAWIEEGLHAGRCSGSMLNV